MDIEQVESSQRQHHEVLRHNEAMIEAITGADYKLFALIKPKLYKDDNQWYCVYGRNRQVGIVGSGDTPHEAVLNWNAVWNKR